MATTDAEVCSQALLNVGVKRPIASLSDTTPEAYACNAIYATTRNVLLKEVDWSFARKRKTDFVYVGSPGAPTTRTGWGFEFDVPADFLKARYVHPGTRTPTPSQRIPYAIEPNDAGTGMILLCDLPTPELVYTFKHVTVTLWPDHFVDALAWRLSQRLIIPLAIDMLKARQVMAAGESFIARAFAMELREEQEDQPPDSEFITVR